MFTGILKIAARICAISVLLIFTSVITHSVYSKSGCDENKIEAVNDVKRTVENSLINAVSVTKLTEGGIELMAFYLEGKLLKISATNSLSGSEQIFFNQNTQFVYYERSGYLDGNPFFYIYYFNENKLFCIENGLNGKPMKKGMKDEQEVIDVVESYMHEVQ
jgi:hypothetical protein